VRCNLARGALVGVDSTNISATRSAQHIAVIGGGLGGLATCALLAAAGHRVTVLEQNDWLGGKSRRIELLGQRIDTGPSLVTFPSILREVLRRYEDLSGTRIDPDRQLEMFRLSEVGRYFYRDEAVDLPVPESHKWGDAWSKFALERETDETDIAHLLSRPISDITSLRATLRLAVSWHGRINAAGYLRSLRWMPEELREIIAIHSLNAGLPPSKTLTLFASLPAIMAKQGVMVPRGGVYEIARLLADLARESGAQLRTGVLVSKIEPAASGAVVHTDQGAETYSHVVLAADNPKLDPERSERANAKLSCSGVAIFGVLKQGRSWRVVNHSVVLPDNPQLMDASLARGQWPDQTMSFVNYYPAGEIYPNQRDVVAILLTAPADGSAVDLQHPMISSELERIRSRLGIENAILEDLEQLQILDPSYFGGWGGHGGALYGEARGLLRSGPFHRPRRRNRAGWLWRVGSAVHPGGGIPAVLGGALITTEQLLKNLERHD
jgi:phytoene desaturase